MSVISVAGRKSLMLFSGRAYPELADEIAAHIGVTVTDTTARDFANGETFIKSNESVRGSDAFVIQSYTTPINQWVMESLILVDSLKRASAKRITVVAPFYPYARQDKKHRGREPISARLIADLFKTAGADRLMAVDLHTAQIQGFFDGPVDHLFALPLLAEHVKAKYGDEDIVVVSPDTGRVRAAEQWADELGGLDIAFVHKTRDLDAANEVVANRVVGEVAGKCCLLIDDMIDTGGSITKAADLLFDSGATDVVVAATHGIFSPPATDRLKNSRIREVIVTNTLPIRPEQDFDKLTVLSIAPLLAQAIRAVFEDGSVTSLFAGEASPLDLLLIAALRTWFARPEAEAPAWYLAHSDRVVGLALRLLQDDPAHPWTAECAGPPLRGPGRRTADGLPRVVAPGRRPAARARRHGRRGREAGRLRQLVRPQRRLQAGPRHQPARAPGPGRRGAGAGGRDQPLAPPPPARSFWLRHPHPLRRPRQWPLRPGAK